jgi:hypothetical protein
MSIRSTQRRVLFALTTVVVTSALLLFAAEKVSQRLLNPRLGNPAAGEPRAGTAGSYVYDALLGWKVVPGRGFRGGKAVTTNAQGLRANREYDRAVPDGRFRIVFVGDSFTHGAGTDDETYPAQLEQLSPTIEAVNMGSRAYGVDQMYLLYKRDGIALGTNLLVVAFVEDDFKRMTSDTFRLVRPKPQLVVRGNTLALSNVPVPLWDRFPHNTALFKILHRAGEQLFNHDVFPVVELIFEDLKALSRERHQELVLVYLPSAPDQPGSSRPPRDIVRRVEQIANDRQILFWNLTSMFRAIPASEVGSYFVPDGHYSPRGNRLVATTLLEALERQFPIDSRTTPLQ